MLVLASWQGNNTVIPHLTVEITIRNYTRKLVQLLQELHSQARAIIA